MFAVEKYAAIRDFVLVQGNSRREAVRFFGISRDTVSKMCAYSASPGLPPEPATEAAKA